MFAHVDPYAGDPILSLNEQFGQDARPHKINLSIGLYFDAAGQLSLMHAVRQAALSLAQTPGPKPYLPMEGSATYRQAVQQLLLGCTHEAVQTERVTTVQTLGGSGALKVGADFLKRYFPASQVWVSSPTWDNHRAIFEGAGFVVNTYPYYDTATGGLAFSDMLATFQALPAHSVVVLHACCHNPTGVDLTAAHWAQLIEVIKRKKLIPYVDMAYQGFGQGLEEDAQNVRALARAGISFFCAHSFSKNFSLYGERCGALSVVCPDATQAKLVLGQLKAAVRQNYSSPPAHGARIVTHVLQTPALREQWCHELQVMRERIAHMRTQLHQALVQLCPSHNFNYLLEQCGMFSYTGLLPEQVERLRTEHAIYLLRSGRLCLAGLNHSNFQAVALAMACVLGLT
jgi:aromatic-amino-acid transaminase